MFQNVNNKEETLTWETEWDKSNRELLCVQKFTKDPLKALSHCRKKKGKGYIQIPTNISMACICSRDTGEFMLFSLDLVVGLSNCLRRRCLAWWAEHGHQRQGTWLS